MLANQVVRQVSWALAFLHQQQWVHRDIKPANLAVQGALVMKVPVKNQCSGEEKESLTKMREMIIRTTRVLLSSHLAKTSLVIWRLVIWSDWCIFVALDLLADFPPKLRCSNILGYPVQASIAQMGEESSVGGRTLSLIGN